MGLLGEARDQLTQAEQTVSGVEEELRPLGGMFVEIAHELVEASEALHRALEMLNKAAMRGS